MKQKLLLWKCSSSLGCCDFYQRLSVCSRGREKKWSGAHTSQHVYCMRENSLSADCLLPEVLGYSTGPPLPSSSENNSFSPNELRISFFLHKTFLFVAWVPKGYGRPVHLSIFMGWVLAAHFQGPVQLTSGNGRRKELFPCLSWAHFCFPCFPFFSLLRFNLYVHFSATKPSPDTASADPRSSFLAVCSL